MTRLKSFITRNHRKASVAVMTFSLALAATCAPAFATGTGVSADGYDVGGMTTGIVQDVTQNLTYILPIAGGLLALGIAWKLGRKMFKA
jgi:hypothetical protein